MSYWLHSRHYHCKSCGSDVERAELDGYSDDWRPWRGVRRHGACRHCGKVFVEYEYTPLQTLRWYIRGYEHYFSNEEVNTQILRQKGMLRQAWQQKRYRDAVVHARWILLLKIGLL